MQQKETSRLREMTKGLRCNWKPYQKTAKAFALAVKICTAINKEKGKYDRNTRCWLMLCWWCSRRKYWESLATDAKLTLNLSIKRWIFIPCAVLKMIKQKPWNHAVSRLLVWQGQKDLNPRHAVLETAALPTELYPYIKFFLTEITLILYIYCIILSTIIISKCFYEASF